MASHGVLQKDDNGYPVAGGVSSVNATLVLNATIDPITGRLRVTNGGGGGGGGTGTWYTVTGTIDGVNTTFTIPVAPTSDFLLFLARQPQMLTTDFSVVGSTITMTYAPDSSLSSQPFMAFVIS